MAQLLFNALRGKFVLGNDSMGGDALDPTKINGLNKAEQHDWTLDAVSNYYYKTASDVQLAMPGLKMWLPAHKLTGLSDDDPLTTWTDSSPNNNDASQSSATLKPLYKTNILNGKPVIRFDGTDDYMNVSAITGVDWSDGEKALIMVVKCNTAESNFFSVGSANYQTWQLQSSPTNNYFQRLASSNGSSWNEDNVGDVALDAFKIVSIIGDGSTEKAYVNGVLQFTDTHGAFSLNNSDIKIGAHYSLAPYMLDGDIAEILVGNKCLSDTEHIEQLTRLDAFYNLGIY